MYEGRTSAESGIVFGHENMGIITEIGSGVQKLKVGDRVVMPFNVACKCRMSFSRSELIDKVVIVKTVRKV